MMDNEQAPNLEDVIVAVLMLPFVRSVAPCFTSNGELAGIDVVTKVVDGRYHSCIFGLGEFYPGLIDDIIWMVRHKFDPPHNAQDAP